MNSQEVDNVTQIFALIMSKALAHERFKCVKSYAGIEEDTPVQLLNGCDFFMVTPSSLMRLLKKKQVTLGSLDHLVSQREPVMLHLSLYRGICSAAQVTHKRCELSAFCMRACTQVFHGASDLVESFSREVSTAASAHSP